ncbi:hypothetical protein WICPIJ_001565 [Wickerhamomyces pijperi]|uniref:Uncharacterized protein n=1 Tax=Wickerhamomyces pijperi TaxID=599730 RepID=A0A9P8TQL9_WICPI|nr:hypothetical protein WICPIJ_001565 [Wickerhamomyces pijperi]
MEVFSGACLTPNQSEPPSSGEISSAMAMALRTLIDNAYNFFEMVWRAILFSDSVNIEGKDLLLASPVVKLNPPKLKASFGSPTLFTSGSKFS